MKKVLFVISTLNTGGAQRAFSNIIMALPEEYDVDILLNDAENIVYPYRGEIIDLGIKPQKDKMKIGYQLKVFLRRYMALKRLKKKGNYIACISALESANFVNVLTGRKRCKCIISIRNFYEKAVGNQCVSKLVGFVIRHFYNYADKIVAVSEGISRSLIEDYGLSEDKVCTIYNGYNVEKIIEDSQQPIEEKIKLDLSGRVIVASGRLSEQKGFQYLIKCFSRIVGDYQDIKLVILGEGELRIELEELIEQLGVKNKVFMPGFIKNPFAVISKCDVFVLSSLHEGYPNVLAEAMICGVPCIATDCRTGPREILGNGAKSENKDVFELAEYGILCPSFLDDSLRAAQGLEHALRELLSNKYLYQYYKEQCDKKKSQMEIKKIVRQWIDVIE